MIWQQQSERHLRVAPFCFFHAARCHAVKVSIPSHNEICHAVLYDMPLYLGGKDWQQSIWSLPVPNEKAQRNHIYASSKRRYQQFDDSSFEGRGFRIYEYLGGLLPSI